jgi:hypothetical protein
MIYEQPVIFALPSFAITAGAGLEGLFTWLPSARRAAATFAVMLAYLAGYLWLSRDVHALRTLPIQPTERPS